jgi:hypothetical protein
MISIPFDVLIFYLFSQSLIYVFITQGLFYVKENCSLKENEEN